MSSLLKDNYDRQQIVDLSKDFEKVVCVGYMDKGTGKHQSNSVYSILALSPTICASGERMRQYLWILV